MKIFLEGQKKKKELDTAEQTAAQAVLVTELLSWKNTG